MINGGRKRWAVRGLEHRKARMERTVNELAELLPSLMVVFSTALSIGTYLLVCLFR